MFSRIVLPCSMTKSFITSWLNSNAPLKRVESEGLIMARDNKVTKSSSAMKKVYVYTLCRKHPDDWTKEQGELLVQLLPSDDVGQKARFLLEAHMVVNGSLPAKLYVMHQGETFVVRTHIHSESGRYYWTVERPVQQITGGSMDAPPEIVEAMKKASTDKVGVHVIPETIPEGWDKLDQDQKD